MPPGNFGIAMFRVTVVFLSFVSLLMAQACTPTKITRGHHLAQEDIDRIQVGITTQQQVGSLLGSPSSVATFNRGSDVWYYISTNTEQYTELDESTVAQRVVAISFDQEGRVATLKDYSLKDAKDISFASRKTPTQGDKLTLLEQLFQSMLGTAGSQ